jgi:UDP-N-acetylglucosamine:LPS N-acetylglucosamine transferase
MNAPVVSTAPSQEGSRKGLKVLFLSSDTGGGHRASAESLAKQFELLYPGSTYDLLDVVEKDGVPPYNSLVSYYKHLSAHPTQWKIVYGFSNSRAFEMLADAHLKLMCERAVRKRIRSYNPDVVISVHPLMTNVPILSCAKISNETGRHLPIFTVVTDLGSAHCLWFANGVERMFVGSEQVYELAKSRGKVPDGKLVLAGLPIRHEFALQSEKLGDRMSPAGKAYQKLVRADLGLPLLDRHTLLVMGGGEGVGSLSNIVNALYVELTLQGVDALVLVVCGRNDKLRTSLETRDWQDVLRRYRTMKEKLNKGLGFGLLSFGDISTCGGKVSTNGCIEGTVTSSLRRILSTGSISLDSPLSFSFPSTGVDDEKKVEEELRHGKSMEEAGVKPVEASKAGTTPPHQENRKLGEVKIVGLGFVSRMAEYMVAADLLITKAGPGTISEAAALSLPIMLTSYLPGQEEGNVDYVVDGGFGAYCSDVDPVGIAEEVVMCLNDENKMASMSAAAKAKGKPYAARDIAKAIGDSTLKWREINEERAAAAAVAEAAESKS